MALIWFPLILHLIIDIHMFLVIIPFGCIKMNSSILAGLFWDRFFCWLHSHLPLLEPKKTCTPKITCTRFFAQLPQKNHTTLDDHQKWPNRYHTTPFPMMDFCHYLAKNHARKIPIKPKYSSGPRVQSRWAPWRCTTVWSFAGIPTRQVMFSAINIIISMDIDDDMMEDAIAVSQNSNIGWFEYFLNAWPVVFREEVVA